MVHVSPIRSSLLRASVIFLISWLGAWSNVAHGAHDYELTQVAANSEENSPKEALRRKLFANPTTPRCQLATKDPRAKLDFDPALQAFVSQIITRMKSLKEVDLAPLFHPRLNVSLAALGEILAKLPSTYGSPLDFSLLRLWALNTVDGTPGDLECVEDQVTLYAQYGYPLQFGLWIQVLGAKEVGRIYISIVPSTGQWYIGGLHVQQWTHDGKDPALWMKEADADRTKGLPEAAFAKYDIAYKLTDGGKLLALKDHDAVSLMRDLVMKPAVWDKKIRAVAKPADIVYTSTLLVNGGVGILMRQRMPGEISVEKIKSDCKDLAAKVARERWAKSLAGIRCSYLLPQEAAEKEGAMGGIYIPFAEVAR